MFQIWVWSRLELTYTRQRRTPIRRSGGLGVKLARSRPPKNRGVEPPLPAVGTIRVAYDLQEELRPREGFLDWDPVQAGADLGDNLRRRGHWSSGGVRLRSSTTLCGGEKSGSSEVSIRPQTSAAMRNSSLSAAFAATGKRNCRKEAAKASRQTSVVGRVVYGQTQRALKAATGPISLLCRCWHSVDHSRGGE